MSAHRRRSRADEPIRGLGPPSRTLGAALPALELHVHDNVDDAPDHHAREEIGRLADELAEQHVQEVRDERARRSNVAAFGSGHAGGARA